MAKESPGEETVGKRELAKLLKWSRPTLDLRLKTDPSFPVVTRGDRSGGWEFSPSQVLAYLSGHAAAGSQRKARVVKPASKTEPKVTELPAEQSPSAQHFGEATARQRRDTAQAMKIENELRRTNKELVESEAVRISVSTMLVHLGKGLDGLPDMVVKRLGVPEEKADIIREMVDDLRRNIVSDLKEILGPSA